MTSSCGWLTTARPEGASSSRTRALNIELLEGHHQLAKQRCQLSFMGFNFLTPKIRSTMCAGCIAANPRAIQKVDDSKKPRRKDWWQNEATELHAGGKAFHYHHCHSFNKL
mmetsp:Transcript_24216/g.39604  ORF Transcript_24216/g.39604 Transcript_24216/m.39604 type:complete len:111 (-) Transcript_24216:45-377(-)